MSSQSFVPPKKGELPSVTVTPPGWRLRVAFGLVFGIVFALVAWSLFGFEPWLVSVAGVVGCLVGMNVGTFTSKLLKASLGSLPVLWFGKD